MSDFAAPAGPPPPKVPEGWKVQWNDQYSEWFYVNIYTKKSQWDKPTEPVYPPKDEAPSGAPPGYAPNGGSSVGGVGLTNTTAGQTDQKPNPYDPKPNSNNTESDEELARRLQAEEDARSQGTRSAQQDYMNTPMTYPNSGSSPYPQQQQGGQYPPQPNYAQQGQQSYPEQLPPREQKKSGGFLGKLLAKASASGKPHGGGYGQQQQQGGYGQQGHPQQYGGGGYGQQGMMGGGYGQQGHGYGQPMMGGGGYGRPQKKPGGGMGMAGGAALGLGGGLIGGAMLANAFDDDNEDYREGYQDAMQDDNDFGGDDGGGGDD